MNIDSRGAYTTASSELDLFGLVRAIWPRRAFIAAVAGIFAVGGVILAYVIPPEYEASTTLTPVELNQLDALNRSKIYSLPPEDALKRVGAKLSSYTTRLEYFRSRPDLVQAFQRDGQSVEQAFQDFNSTALSSVQAGSDKSDSLTDFVSLKMRYGSDIDGAAVLNEFVDFAVGREREQLSRDVQVILANRLAEVDNKLNSAITEYRVGNEGRIARLEEGDAIKRAQLNDELKALQVQLKLKRQARLAELDEAISIARSLGLRRPSTPSLMAEDFSGKGNIVRTEVNGRSVPLYFMGTEVLEAERNALGKRTTDDFVEPRIGEIRKELLMLARNPSVEAIRARVNENAFLEGVEALRVERQRLQSINAQLESLQLVSVDKRAVASSKPVKPHKALIVMVSFAGGLLLGVIISLSRIAYKIQSRRVQAGEVGGARAPILPGDLGRQASVLLPDSQVKIPQA